MTASAGQLVEAALAYARRGWRVIPLHGVSEGGSCTCRKRECNSVGKHPLTDHGLTDGTTEEEVIRRWWTRWPTANVGIVTGAASGLLVLDIDPRHGGEVTLEELDRQHGPLPETVEVLTGGGGRHLYFRHPGEIEIRNNAGKLGPGVDVRGDGGYVVAPPSIHVQGLPYAFECSHDPDDHELSPLPTWLKEKLTSDSGRRSQPAAPEGRVFRDGERNDRLFSMACSMRSRGMSVVAIEAGLLEENGSRCRPPLEDAEVHDIAGSTGRYKAGPNILQYPLTDLGNAERLVALHGHELVYCFQTGRWHVWSGNRWAPDDTCKVLRLAKRTVRGIIDAALRLPDDKKEWADKLIKFARRSESHPRLKAIVALAESERSIAVRIQDFDADRWALNVLNGTIDLRTGKLRPHDPAELHTALCPVSYDPEATCPAFDQFIEETTCGSEHLATFIQQLLGLCLTGVITEQILPVFWGVGANGKSTLLDLLLWIMEGYAGLAAPDLLVAKQWTQHPTEIADLCGKRLVVASETERNQHLRVQFVKQVTGDVRLKARYMRRDFFECDRQFKVILMTNNKPIVGEQTHAIWRRLKLVPFSNVVPDDQQDKHLLEKLKAEAPGILAWLVRGCLSWQREGLIYPAEVIDATEAYRAESDWLERFVEECLDFASGVWTASGRLADTFRQWCREAGVDCASLKDLHARLRQAGCGSSRWQGNRGWRGVRIVPDLSQESD